MKINNRLVSSLSYTALYNKLIITCQQFLADFRKHTGCTAWVCFVVLMLCIHPDVELCKVQNSSTLECISKSNAIKHTSY